MTLVYRCSGSVTSKAFHRKHGGQQKRALTEMGVILCYTQLLYYSVLYDFLVHPASRPGSFRCLNLESLLCVQIRFLSVMSCHFA